MYNLREKHYSLNICLLKDIKGLGENSEADEAQTLRQELRIPFTAPVWPPNRAGMTSEPRGVIPQPKGTWICFAHLCQTLVPSLCSG